MHVFAEQKVEYGNSTYGKSVTCIMVSEGIDRSHSGVKNI